MREVLKFEDYFRLNKVFEESEDVDEFGLDSEIEPTVDSIDSEINDPVNDNPEVYIMSALKKLKRKIESYFNYINESVDENLTFKDIDAKLESIEITKGTKTHKTLTFKYTTMDSYYTVYIRVNLKEALDAIKNKEELIDESIQKCFLKMKKIDTKSFEELGMLNRNLNISEIDEQLLIELKLELDDSSVFTGDEDETLKIEI